MQLVLLILNFYIKGCVSTFWLSLDVNYGVWRFDDTKMWEECKMEIQIRIVKIKEWKKLSPYRRIKWKP